MFFSDAGSWFLKDLHRLLYFSFSPSLPVLCLCIFTTPSPVLLSSFSLLYPLNTDQNLECHWHIVCLSQSDTSHHGNCAELSLHFTLHPPALRHFTPVKVTGGGRRGWGEGRYQIYPLGPAYRPRHTTKERQNGTPHHYNLCLSASDAIHL